MKLNKVLIALPLTILLASCGGGESEDVNADVNNNNQEEKFGSAFGDCAGSNAFTYTDAMKENTFFKDYFANDESYEYHGGELRKNKKGLTIEFANNEAIISKSYSSYKPGDVSFRLTISSEEILKAGEYTSDEISVGVTRGEKVDGKIRSASIGSNKITEKITLNKISRGHACGTYTMTDEAGNNLLTIEFDTNIEMSAW